MKRMWAVYGALAAISYLIGSTLIVAGAFKSIVPRPAEVIDTYAGIFGPEDMQLDPQSGRLYISSSNRWRTQHGLPANDDGLWILDVDSGSRPRRLTHDYPRELHPHGIFFLRKQEANFLFVVNHNPQGDFVERFLVQGDSLVFQRSFANEMMCCPNDVAAVDVDRFYVTNDHGAASGFGRTLEDYGRLPNASVLYVNGEAFSTACDGLRYANGINISADGTRLYVAATTGRELRTYERNPSDDQVTLLQTLRLGTGVDNIDVDADGNLWIAAHPKLLAFVAHSKDSSKRSPSQVLRLSPLPGDTYRVQEVFLDDGTVLSGSSIAVRYNDQLFVGGVFQPRILRLHIGPDTLR